MNKKKVISPYDGIILKPKSGGDNLAFREYLERRLDN